MIRLTKENWDSKNNMYKNISFTTTGETKTISGYNCKKATAKLEDGKTLTVYYTTDISLQNKQYDATFANLPGLPLEYEIETGKLKFNYSLSKISFDAVPLAKFDFPTTGYRVMTYEENQQMKKGN
jgi:GLPGLI family protein